MPSSCGLVCGSWRRRVRDTGDTRKDSQNSGRTRQSSPPDSPSLQKLHVNASLAPIISRAQSTSRQYRIFSLGYYFSLFLSPFLSAFSGKGKRAADIPSVLEIEGSIEETPLVEAVKGGDGGGLAMKKYSVSPADYRLLEVVGQGATATVYRALYIPYNEIVAVKRLDLELCNANLDNISREAQTMSLAYHPNLIKGYCSFVVEHCLWFVMPFMAEGSCFHLMKVAYPDGFEEHVICSILKETLKALEYLHKHGHIHRDVKAGNILLDSSGVVKLSDFGITAYMFDKGNRLHSRNTFVGTPCWMAPEVMQPGGGYDFKADIWSFGITALELAHGHAPFSKYPPMKVFLMTLQNAPPGLDYDRDKKFSKSFKEMVAMCLVKDQTKRPTAEKLLKHSFFKNMKPPEFSVKNLFTDLPPLWESVKALQLKDAELLALKKMPTSDQEALSQTEYQRGVSAWNFDIEDLKVQAALIVDDKDIDETAEGGGSLRNFNNDKEPYISRHALEKPLAYYGNSDRDEGENRVSTERYRPDGRKAPNLCGPLMLPNRIPTERYRPDGRKAPNLSGPLMLPNHASANNLSVPSHLSRGCRDHPEDMSRENWVQMKGRFSVKYVNVDIVKPVNQLPKDNGNISLLASILVPHLQNILQQTSFQQDLITNFGKSMHENDLISGIPLHTFKPVNDFLVKAAITERELLLLVKISELQARISNLTDELTATRLKQTQLQQELNIAYSKRDGERI